jgi:hypothetical protein
MLPSPEAEPDRYRGRPLLVVLENYILAAIGELSAEKQARVTKIVQTVFGDGTDWMKTVRRQLRLGDGLDASLREMWERNQATAAQNGITFHPVQFAKMVADQNFAELIGPPLK